MVKLGDAYVAIGSKDELDKGLNAARRKVNGFLNDLTTGIGQGIGQVVARGIGSVISNVMSEIPRATQAASDLTEAVNKAGVAFGDSTQEILDWSKTSATAFGQSRQGALEAASTFGLLFRTMGLTNEASADMSRQLVELASDLASINNISPEEALIKLRAGLVGEIEPLRTVGVLLSATAVEAKAMSLGLAESSDALTEQDKVLARYQLILDQTTLAQGDFARNTYEVANQQRILAAQIENGRALLGQAFTPIYAVVLRGLNDLIRDVSGYGDGIVQALANGMVDGIIYLLPVIRTIRDIFTYWLRPQSPPRILPDLDKWGAGAMEAYLRGFAKADFGSLRNLGSAIEGILRSFVGTGRIQETDLVARVFGSQAAISRAISEWREMGSVSTGALEAIRRAAGPAGDSVTGLVRAYFELQDASRAAADAQDQLTRVTERYDRILSPLQGKLDAVQSKQQELRDERRLFELDQIIGDRESSTNERRLAQLEKEEIQLRQQIGAIEEERDVAVDAEQQKVDAREEEVRVKQDAFDQQQALLDQQVNTNRLIAEENALRQRLASEALAAQEKALRELEAEQRKAEAAEKARLMELERTYQAQLSYNLAIADTPGKIALMKLELQRYAEGSADYYRTLEQIYSLEQQLTKEREAGAGSGAGLLPDILPPVDSLEIPTWASELAQKLQSAIDKTLGEKKDFGISIAEGSSLFNRIIGPEPEKIPEVSQDVTEFVEALKGLTTAVAEITPALEGLATLFGVDLPDAAETGGTETVGSTTTHLQEMAKLFNFWTQVMSGDWGALWDNYVEAAREDQRTTAEDQVAWLGTLLGNYMQWRTDHEREWGLGLTNTSKALGQWLTDTATAISEFDLVQSGRALLGSLYSGLQSYWTETVQPWWKEKTKWIADLLPGSEPKNPQSPLRGLSRRGEALMDNLHRGMELGARQLQTEFTANLAALPAAIPSMVNSGNSSNTYGPIHLHFTGPVSDTTVRNAARTVDDELRSRGWK